MNEIPSLKVLTEVTLDSLRKLGGSAHYKKIEQQAAQDLKLTDEPLNRKRKGKRTEFSYRMSWARTACKNKGLIRNKGGGFWELIS